MTRFALLFLLVLPAAAGSGQTICNNSGNLVIFSNYDGGQLTIQVDVDIPNLRIGICTYEACQVVITGPFAGNVTAVRYAGFEGDNDHCGLGYTSSSITGVPAGITTVAFAPAGTLPDPNGYPNIICAYSCGAGNQGGCNTAAQVVSYFTSTLGGSLRMYYTQYGCWPSGAIPLSGGGTCCPNQQGAPVASFSVSSASICPGECVTPSNTSTGSATQYAWVFNGGSPLTSTAANPGAVCFEQAGTYQLVLTASNANGSTSASQTVQVGPCEIPGCRYPAALNYNPAATVDDGSCAFAECPGGCPADLDQNGVVGIGDLLVFISLFGATCGP